MERKKDLTNKKFGRLKVISYEGNNKYRKALWLCRCDCGKTKIVLGSSLLNNSTKSCGCYNREKSKKNFLKHNLSYSKLYKVWQGIKTRCYNNNFIYYCNYGGRGIKMCDEWKNDFVTFYDWALNNGYQEGLTIDRINNNDDYCPTNCRWTTREEQNNNMRKTILVEYKGKLRTITELANEFGLKRKELYYKLKKGWTIEQIINTITY